MKRLIVMAILVSTSTFARSYEYDCYSYYWNGDRQENGTMSLEVNARTASAEIHDEFWNRDLGGRLNPSYQSRTEIPFVKFGRDLVIEKSLITGGRRLRDGNWGGIARVEGITDGDFFQYKFICKLK